MGCASQGIDTDVGDQQVVHLGLSQEWPLQILDASGMPEMRRLKYNWFSLVSQILTNASPLKLFLM